MNIAYHQFIKTRVKKAKKKKELMYKKKEYLDLDIQLHTGNMRKTIKHFKIYVTLEEYATPIINH